MNTMQGLYGVLIWNHECSNRQRIIEEVNKQTENQVFNILKKSIELFNIRTT